MIETLLTDAFSSFAAQSAWEWLAAAFGVIYVVLAARESAWCWPAGFLSTLIYTLLFWHGQLPMQSLLNFYYLGMAVYGWQEWRKTGVRSTSDSSETAAHTTDDNKQSAVLKIQTLNFQQHFAFVLFGFGLSYLLGTWLQVHNLSVAPFLDATVTVFSVMTTYLIVKKVLENWLYWIAIDALAIWLYLETGYTATVVMYAIYCIIAIIGLRQWQKSYQRQQAFIE